MKRTKGTVERFSPDWVRMIPHWLARGIWEAIEESTNEGGHSHAKESARRKRQIERGIIKQ